MLMLMTLAFMVAIAGCSKQSHAPPAHAPQGIATREAAANISSRDRSTLGDKWKQEFGELPTRKGTTVFVSSDGHVEGVPAELYDVALNPGEADWLSRKGFLSASERARLSVLPDEELKSRIGQGDRSALLYLAEKMIDRGEGREMASALAGLAYKENSIPARYLLARYESQGIDSTNMAIPQSADPAAHQVWREDEMRRQKAASYLMQNYLMGDYRAGQMLYDLYPEGGRGTGTSRSDYGIPPPVLTKAMQAIQDARIANPTFAAGFDPRPMPKGTFGRQSGQITQ